MNEKREMLKRTLADLTPEELVFVDEFIDAVVAGDEEKQYQMWRDVLMKFDEIPDDIKDKPFVQRYLKEVRERAQTTR